MLKSMAFVLPPSGYFIQGSMDQNHLAVRGSLTSLTNQNAVRSMEPKRMISKSFLIFKNEQKTKSTLRTDFSPDGASPDRSRIWSVLILEKTTKWVTVGTMQLVPEQPFPLA